MLWLTYYRGSHISELEWVDHSSALCVVQFRADVRTLTQTVARPIWRARRDRRVRRSRFALAPVAASRESRPHRGQPWRLISTVAVATTYGEHWISRWQPEGVGSRPETSLLFGASRSVVSATVVAVVTVLTAVFVRTAVGNTVRRHRWLVNYH